MIALFMRKESEIEAQEAVVEKVIVLPKEEYIHFTENLMHDYDFLKENANVMYEENDVWHCVLVTGEGVNEGVLVESEGASYARYSAFVPVVNEIIEQFNAIQELETSGMKMNM